MTAPVHVVGGIVITGITAAMADINILENPMYLVTTIFASMLPDIDHGKSPIGKLFFFISKPIGDRYGHRTITHSFACLFVLTGIVSFITSQFTEGMSYGTVFFIAYFSHLFLDMITVMGVPLFYPFWKNNCVIPGNPNNRFESGRLSTETGTFFFFIAMGIFMQPLMEQGFWTTYNRSFGTMRHLFSEFRKSDDLLQVDYLGNRGSEEIAGTGLLINAEENKATLVQDNNFFVLDGNDFVITEVIPTHTGRKYYFKNQTFINIDIDSLNKLSLDNLVSKIEVHGTTEFDTRANNIQHLTSTQFKGELYSNLFFQKKEKVEKVEIETYRHQVNPRIQLLREKVTRLQTMQAETESRNQRHQTKLTSLRNQAKSETNYLKREELISRIKQLEKEPGQKDYSDQIQNAKIQLRETKELDRMKRVEGNLSAAEKNSNRVGGEEIELRLTGFITTLTIED